MAIGMSAVLVAEAICVSVNNTQAALAAVVFVFAFEACFTWGTLAQCPKEIQLAELNRMDGNGLVLPTGDPTIENPCKRCCTGRRRRFPRQLHCGRNHPTGSPKHRIQDLHHLCSP